MGFKKELREQLRKGLSKLPTPKNDYEIVVPESDDVDDSNTNGNEMDTMENGDNIMLKADQAEIDEKNRLLKQKQGLLQL